MHVWDYMVNIGLAMGQSGTKFDDWYARIPTKITNILCRIFKWEAWQTSHLPSVNCLSVTKGLKMGLTDCGTEWD